MASPHAMGRPRRAAATRGALRQAQEDEEEAQLREELGEEEDEEEAPRGRRPGKEPVGEDEEDYEPDADDDGAEQQRQQTTGRRRGRAGGDGEEAGPSKRGRRGGAAVKQEPGGDPAGAAGVAADGAPRATAGELRAVDEKIAEYRRVRDHEADRAEGKVSRPALEQASRAVVRHMLFAHSEKPGVPVKRAEIAAVVTARFPNLKSKAVVTNYVIAHAAHYLAEGMGLEMASVPKLAARGRGAEGPEEGGQQFVLRSLVPPALRAAYVRDPRAAPQHGLLMLVLSLIQLAGGKLAEEDLWAQLGEMAIERDAPHPAFGRVPEQLKTFCARRYIQVSKQQGPDGEAILYHFAEQAFGDHAEISQEAITQFIEEQFAAA